MSVLLLSEVFPPQTGGSGRWLWEIYRRFPREEAVIAAGEHPGAADFDRSHDVNVLRAPLILPEWGISRPAGLRGYWKALQALRRILKSHDVHEIHCARCLPEGWMALLLKRIYRIPYVCYVHGEELSLGTASREFGWQMRRVFRGARLIVANSRNTSRLLAEQWPDSGQRVRVLHPGVDADRFIPAPRDEAFRQRFGWEGRRIILTVGRLQRRKGHDQLIRAIRRIRERVPNVLYAIVGNGEERERLVQLVQEEGVAAQVQFLGEIADDELIRCYQQCDLFVLPNRDLNGDIEGFGMVLVEAQACGKPVIAGDSGGTAETMRIPETGCVIPCDTPDQLAELISQWLPDELRLARMGRAARRWVEAQFNWPALYDQARTLLDPAVPSNHPGLVQTVRQNSHPEPPQVRSPEPVASERSLQPSHTQPQVRP